MIGDEIPRLQSLEQRERVRARKMSLAKSWLPPWRVTDRQECEIQIPAVALEVFVYEVVGVCRQSSIASEEARYFFSINQIHIRCATPAIYPVPVSLLRCGSRSNRHAIQLGCFSR